MNAINFIKKYDKPYIGKIDEKIVDENGFNYYHYYIGCECFYLNKEKTIQILYLNKKNWYDIYKNRIIHIDNYKIDNYKIDNYKITLKNLLILTDNDNNDENLTLIFDDNHKYDIINNRTILYNDIVNIKCLSRKCCSIRILNDIDYEYYKNIEHNNNINIILNTSLLNLQNIVCNNLTINSSLPNLQNIICNNLKINEIQPSLIQIKTSKKVILNQTLPKLIYLISNDILINAIQPSIENINTYDNKIFKYLDDYLIKMPKLRRIDNGCNTYLINNDFIDIYKTYLYDVFKYNNHNFFDYNIIDYLIVNKNLLNNKINLYCNCYYLNTKLKNLDYLRINKNDKIDNIYYNHFVNIILTRKIKDNSSIILTNVKIIEINTFCIIELNDNNTQKIIINKNNFNDDKLKITKIKIKVNNKFKLINLFDLINKSSNEIQYQEFNKLYKLEEDDDKYLFIKN